MTGIEHLSRYSQNLPVSGNVPPGLSAGQGGSEVRERFQDFVAGTFYAQMFKALRDTQNKPAYFHGGQAEEVFRGQLDQILSEQLARDHGQAFAEPLFSAFSLQQQRARIRTEV